MIWLLGNCSYTPINMPDITTAPSHWSWRGEPACDWPSSQTSCGPDLCYSHLLGCLGTAALLSSNTLHRALYFSNTLTKTSSILSGLRIPLELELVKEEARRWRQMQCVMRGEGRRMSRVWTELQLQPCRTPPQHSAQLGHKYEEQQKAAHRQLGILGGDPSRLISTLNDSLSTVSIQWHSIHHHYIYNRRYAMPPLTTGWCSGDGAACRKIFLVV